MRLSTAARMTLCAVEDCCQLIRVFSFAVERATDRREGLGERKDVGCDKQIGILGPDRMPVHTIGCNGDFRHYIGSGYGDTFAGDATQRDSAYDSVFGRNLLVIQELTKCVSVGIS